MSKKAFKFYTYRYISKKHIKVLLPELSESNVRQNKYVAMYHNIPSSQTQKNLIRYLEKNETVYILEENRYYCKVITEKDEIGYVNKISLKFEKDPQLATVYRSTGFSGKMINVFLGLYGLANKEGVVNISSIQEFSRMVDTNKTTTYNCLYFLEENGIVSFVNNNVREIKINDFATRKEDGYFRIRTKFLSKKFFQMSTAAKRLTLYILSLQKTNNSQITIKKLMLVSRQNSHFKLKKVIASIEEAQYFDFMLVNNKIYSIDMIKQDFKLNKALDEAGIIYQETLNMIKKSGLYNKNISEEDKYMLAYTYNKMQVTSDIFLSAMKIANKYYINIKTSLPLYVRSIIKGFERNPINLSVT